jgi:formate hydrogenlyase transcriptional activator
MIDPSELARPALEASPIAILIADQQGTIVLVNRALERRFGYRRDELVGNSVDFLLPNSLRAIQDAQSDAARDPQAPPQGTLVGVFGQHQDGSRLAVEMKLSPLRTSDNVVFVLVSIVDSDDGNHRQDAHQPEMLEQQLAFERLVAEMSFQFINLPADQVTDSIMDWLRKTGEQLGLDRCSFFKIGPNGILSDAVSWTAVADRSPDLSLAAERFPWAIERLVAGETVVFSSLADIPNETDRAGFNELGSKSAVLVPLTLQSKVAGAMGFCAIQSPRTWRPAMLRRLDLVASVFNQVLARQERDEAARAAARKVQELKDRLEAENVYLRQEERERLGLTRVIGQSPAVHRVLEQIHQVAPTDSTVLLLGETGTGKELFATQIHELSSRRTRAMVRVNCAAIPATLIESELFGREKGAFTGALARQAGRFELADHSTIFLDEIGDLPPEVQVKLLRVLEERTIERLGSPHSITVNTRIIAATHRNLEQRVAEGTFREDLFYRLNVFPIHVPPLRERVEDIPLLVWRFVEEFSRAFGKRIDSIDRDNLVALQQYPWPGNIRELRNVVERAMIVASSRRLMLSLPTPSSPASRRSQRLLDVEKEHIRGVLESTGWRIRGTGAAADRLGLKPTTLETRMAKLGLKRPGHG